MTSLNQNELEVLRILWERGELKPAEIEAHFAWAIENATLRSVLVNLVEKKQVARRLYGKGSQRHFAANDDADFGPGLCGWLAPGTGSAIDGNLRH